jgi:hypothetical protein
MGVHPSEYSDDYDPWAHYVEKMRLIAAAARMGGEKPMPAVPSLVVLPWTQEEKDSAWDLFRYTEGEIYRLHRNFLDWAEREAIRAQNARWERKHK